MFATVVNVEERKINEKKLKKKSVVNGYEPVWPHVFGIKMYVLG